MTSQSIISSVASEFHGLLFPTQDGYIWQKSPDVYDVEHDAVWEGNWNLVPENNQNNQIQFQKTKATECKWGCPNGHIENHYCYESQGGYSVYMKKYGTNKINQQRQEVKMIYNPKYHVCNHKTHEVCSGSPCCDLFWHEGKCRHIKDMDVQ